MRGADDNVAQWMPLYIQDLFADTDDLSVEEFGTYLRLLLQMWSRGGTLPCDPERLARLARIDRASLDRVWLVIGRLFGRNTDGTLTQKRLALELEKARTVRLSTLEKAQKGGKASAAKRKQMALELEPEAAPGVEPGVDLSCTSEPGPGPGPGPGSGPRPEPEEKPAHARGKVPSLYTRVLTAFKAAWLGAYDNEYLPMAQDEGQLSRMLNHRRGGVDLETVDWRAVFGRYVDDRSQWTAGEKRHSLAHFCSSGGLNKYRVPSPVAGYSDKEIRGMAAGPKFDEMLARMEGPRDGRAR